MKTGSGTRTRREENVYDSGWICVDLGFVWVNIMTDEKRDLYRIEERILEEGGKFIGIDDTATMKTEGEGQGSLQEQQQEQEQDPFWS